MAGAAKATVNHDKIKEWVESRKGSPACVRGTGGKNDPGILRIDFPGYSGEDTLEHISWEDWFQAFDDNELAFLYQDTVEGGESRFFKLVSRDSVDIESETANNLPPHQRKARQRHRPSQG